MGASKIYGSVEEELVIQKEKWDSLHVLYKDQHVNLD